MDYPLHSGLPMTIESEGGKDRKKGLEKILGMHHFPDNILSYEIVVLKKAKQGYC